MIINVYQATNLQQLREAISSLEEFAFVASGRGLHTDEINLECHSNAGVELVLSERKLTDGSKVYDVTFKDLDTRVPEAVYADALAKAGDPHSSDCSSWSNESCDCMLYGRHEL